MTGITRDGSGIHPLGLTRVAGMQGREGSRGREGSTGRGAARCCLPARPSSAMQQDSSPSRCRLCLQGCSRWVLYTRAAAQAAAVPEEAEICIGAKCRSCKPAHQHPLGRLSRGTWPWGWALGAGAARVGSFPGSGCVCAPQAREEEALGVSVMGMQQRKGPPLAPPCAPVALQALGEVQHLLWS